ncbi:MAG: hypothetical protein IPG58_07950 [Acidobacteria bacterium]|nr:hypothetical protein [Acidobacteriota bacterium]
MSETQTILDFFAGSGTTGQAVLELNKSDGGSRRFILCTNNENGVAENVCYERIKKGNRRKPRLRQLEGITVRNKTQPKVLKGIDNIFEEIEQIVEEQGDRFQDFDVKVQGEFLRVFGIYQDTHSKRPANLKYFTTAFVPNILTDNDKRVLVSRSTELLCIAEDTYEKVGGSKKKMSSRFSQILLRLR